MNAFHHPALSSKILQIRGPILVLGASGFVGANLLRALLEIRDDVVGTATKLPSWRLEGLPSENIRAIDAIEISQSEKLLDEIQPQTIFDCIAYGAYSFQTHAQKIYETNFVRLTRLLPAIADGKVAIYIHAGSSSEYGTNSAGPTEDSFTAPNSDYAVSKAAASNLIHYYGQRRRLPCANLRLYSIYGPLEDASRLIPQIVIQGTEGRLPEFVDPQISRDFVYVADVVSAFVHSAVCLSDSNWGDSFNIGTGKEHSMALVAEKAKGIFGIKHEPVFSMPPRSWDLTHWYASIGKSQSVLNWIPKTSFEDGLRITWEWYRSLSERHAYVRNSKQFSS